MDRKLSFAVVGFGRMGITHLAILRTRADLECRGIVEVNRSLRGLVEKHLRLPAYPSLDDILRKGSVDFVVVTTPTHLHEETTIAAIENGADVFVEKPLTTDPASSRRLAEAAKTAGRVGQVGYVNRFNAAFRKARNILRNGALGKIVHVRSSMIGSSMARGSGEGWRAKGPGGGVVLDYGSHAVDLVAFLAGLPVEVEWSRCRGLVQEAAEDVVDAGLILESGATCTLHLNWSDPSYRKPLNRVEIFGDNGRLLVMQHEVHVFLRKRVGELPEGWTSWYAPDLAEGVRFYLRGNEFTLQLDTFVDRVRANREEGKAGPTEAPPDLLEAAAVDTVLYQIRSRWAR